MNYFLEFIGYYIAIPLFVIWFLSTLSASNKVQKPKIFVSDSLMTQKLGAGQVFIMAILIISLLAICERILFDLSRTIGGSTYSYYDDLQTIMVHALFIVPVFVVFIIMNLIIGQNRQKYAVILMPYLATTVFLVMQLVGEISIYFSNHHTTIELYIVLLCIVFIASYAIWYLQGLYGRRLEEMR